MRWRSSAALALIAATLAACAGDKPKRGFRPVSDTPVRVGPPYRAGGRTWAPVDDRGYDAVGYASWYGAAHAGRPTANGERFAPDRISAAHPTLPLPSYVEVTALDTGRTILVRVNDRGPFVAGRIIDLSAGAATLLGVRARGVARVRVRRVEPPEKDRAALRAGRAARARPDADRATLAGLGGRAGSGTVFPARDGGAAARTRGGLVPRTPSPAPQPAVALVASSATSVASLPAGPSITSNGSTATRAAIGEPEVVGMSGRGHPMPHAAPSCAIAGAAGCAIHIEVATFDDADRADGLAAAVSRIAPARATAVGGAYRVRLGPYADAAAAQGALESLARAGYHGARIVRESAAGQEAR